MRNFSDTDAKAVNGRGRNCTKQDLISKVFDKKEKKFSLL
jgi:hypothetical protein